MGSSRQYHNASAGLTLVEVLLALVILGVGMSGLVAATSRCLAVVRKAKNFENARRLLAEVELTDPIYRDQIEEGSYGGTFAMPYDGFRWDRTIKMVGEEEEDGLYEVTTTISWSRRGKRAKEQVVTYIHAPEEVEGGSFESR